MADYIWDNDEILSDVLERKAKLSAMYPTAKAWNVHFYNERAALEAEGWHFETAAERMARFAAQEQPANTLKTEMHTNA
jgi:hypothetical protein